MTSWSSPTYASVNTQLTGIAVYMTSAGNPAAMGDAKDIVYSVIIGLAQALISGMLVDQMVERYGDILPMRALIMDNGSQFGAHRRGDNKEGVG